MKQGFFYYAESFYDDDNDKERALYEEAADELKQLGYSIERVKQGKITTLRISWD